MFKQHINGYIHLAKEQASNPKHEGKTDKEWKHSASKREVNALRAMMQKNAKMFKKKLDKKRKDDEK